VQQKMEKCCQERTLCHAKTGNASHKMSKFFTVFFPSGGPYTPFRRLSNFDIMMFWVCLAVVCAEKLMFIGLYDSVSSSFIKKFCKKAHTITNAEEAICVNSKF